MDHEMSSALRKNCSRSTKILKTFYQISFNRNPSARVVVDILVLGPAVRQSTPCSQWLVFSEFVIDAAALKIEHYPCSRMVAGV